MYLLYVLLVIELCIAPVYIFKLYTRYLVKVFEADVLAVVHPAIDFEFDVHRRASRTQHQVCAAYQIKVHHS